MTNSTSAPVPGTSGVTSGIIQDQVIIATTPSDNYTFKIYLTDSQGTRSNELQGSFPVYPGPVVHLPGYTLSFVAAGFGAADGIGINSAGDIFVVDNQGGRILKVDHLTNAVQTYATGLSFPPDLTFDPLGRLLVISGGGATPNILQVFPGGTTSVFSSGPFSFPTGLKAASDGSIYVTNSGNGTISKVSSTGVAQTYLSGYSTPNGPFGVSVDNVGNVYFADHGTGRIFWADPGKTVSLLATLSPFGPAFSAVDNAGMLYIADSLNASVYRVVNGKVTLFASGFTGKNSPPVIGPTGLAFDTTGNLYVGDGDSVWKISTH
jgi:serine/threonine-protein kinase